MNRRILMSLLFAVIGLIVNVPIEIGAQGSAASLRAVVNRFVLESDAGESLFEREPLKIVEQGLSDQEIDDTAKKMEARRNNVTWYMEREHVRLQQDVLAGRLDAAGAEAQMEKAQQKVLADERENLEKNGEILNDAVGQYHNGEISAQQLNKLFKVGASR